METAKEYTTNEAAKALITGCAGEPAKPIFMTPWRARTINLVTGAILPGCRHRSGTRICRCTAFVFRAFLVDGCRDGRQ